MDVSELLVALEFAAHKHRDQRRKDKGGLATCYESSQGFVVKAVSHAVAESVPSMQQYVRGMHELRQELVGNGVLAAEAGGCHFPQDDVFTSP